MLDISDVLFLCSFWISIHASAKEATVKAVDSSYCETEKGETAPATPTYNEWSAVWENNVGKFRVMLHRMDEDKEGVLKQLGMVDLRRNPDWKNERNINQVYYNKRENLVTSAWN